MIFKNYIKSTDQAVSIVKTIRGYSLMVDIRKEDQGPSWDEAISTAWEAGWELHSDQPDSVANYWEFWTLYPRGDEAA